MLRNRLRETMLDGLFIGMIAAAATAGVLVAFGMGQRHPFLAFNIAAHLLLPGRPTVPGAHPLVTPIGMIVHLGAVLIWSTLFALLVRRRPLPIAALAAALFVAILFAIETRLLPSSLRTGYETILTGAQLLFLYFTLGVSLVIGTRLASSAAE